MGDCGMSTILEAANALRAKAVSPVELTEACLAHTGKLNPTLNAFITVSADTARNLARRAEQEIVRGEWRGPLHGIPIGLKDLIDTAGIPTTAASELYKHRIPIHDAVVARKLAGAGAVLLGKHNLHELAYGASSLISAFGQVRNPWDPARIAGGSSGGSAAAVAAGMGLGAIGTDTAGSIREPAALCGVVGFKPSYGRVSATGVLPLAESLDHVGPIARTVRDAALLLQAIAERHGPGSPANDFLTAWTGPPPKLRLGVPRSFFYDELDAEVAAAVEAALQVMAGLASEIREISLTPDTDRTLQAAEAYAVHAHSVEKTPELFQPETLRRIKTGEHITGEQLARGRARLQAARESIGQVFTSTDLIVTPTTPIPTPAIAEFDEHPEELRPRELLLLRNTRPFNVWGIPTLSTPCGFTRHGLPIGVQIAGPPGRDDLVLHFGHAYEQATAWHERRPAVARTG